MPTDETYDPPSSITKRTHKDAYGCKDRVLAEGYWAQDGWEHSGPDGLAGSHPKWVWVTNTMSKTCNYDQPNDSRCSTCKERKV